MEFSQYAGALRRRWRWPVGTTLLLVLAGIAFSYLTPGLYRAEAQLFVSTGAGSNITELNQGSSFTQRQVVTYADLVSTPIVLEPVLEAQGLDEEVQEFAERVSGEVPKDTVLINIRVSDSSPTEAAVLANAVAEQFVETVQDLERIAVARSSPVKLSVVRPATAPTDAYFPNPAAVITLAAVLGLLVGVAMALLRERLDTRLRDEADVRAATSVPVIGAIAHDPEATNRPLVLEIDPNGARSEAFRSLRTNLQFVAADEAPKVIVITSTLPGEGKSTTTANLALTLASGGHSVCLIEADLRRPKLLEYLGLENAAGLSDVLVDRVDLDDVLQKHVKNLRVIGSGMIPPNPSELLGSHAMRRLIDRLRNDFDYVIIDSPPLLPVTDAAVLAKASDGALVIVGVSRVHGAQFDRAMDSLDKVGARVLGVVLNHVPIKGHHAYSYQGYKPVEVGARRSDLRARRRRAPSRKAG